MLIIIIGLKRGETLLNEFNVRFAAYARFPGIVSCGVHASDTEPTLVMVAPAEAVPHRALWMLADQLGQDCIATYCTVMGRGRLVGPRRMRGIGKCSFLIIAVI